MKKLSALYNLPEEIKFCKKCVISNQRPSSVPEFYHVKERKGAHYIQLNSDGVCEACIQAREKRKLIGKIVRMN